MTVTENATPHREIHADQHQPGGPDELILTPFMTALATALAGNGLDASAGTLVVDPEEFAPDLAGAGLTSSGDALAVGEGHAIDVTANAVDVDETEFTYSILASTMAGAGLAANGDALDVTAGNGTVVTNDALDVDFALTNVQPTTDQTMPANSQTVVPQLFTADAGVLVTAEAGAILQAGVTSDLPPRVGCTLKRVAVQAVANITDTVITWDTPTVNPLGSFWTSGTPTVLVIPVGAVYDILLIGKWGTGVTNASRNYVDFNFTGSQSALGTIRIEQVAFTGADLTIAWPVALCGIPLARLDSITVDVFQTSGGNNNFTGEIHLNARSWL